MENRVPAILSAKTTPAMAIKATQQSADALLKPYLDQTVLKDLA